MLTTKNSKFKQFCAVSQLICNVNQLSDFFMSVSSFLKSYRPEKYRNCSNILIFVCHTLHGNLKCNSASAVIVFSKFSLILKYSTVLYKAINQWIFLCEKIAGFLGKVFLCQKLSNLSLLVVLTMIMNCFDRIADRLKRVNYLSAKNGPANYLSVFDHFVGLAL